MVDTHKCIDCGETFDAEQAKKSKKLGCPFCYTTTGIRERSPEEIISKGENHQEREVMATKKAPEKKSAVKKSAVKSDKKAEVKTPSVKTCFAPTAKNPETPAAIEGAKTGKKQSVKEYAAEVKKRQEVRKASAPAPAAAEDEKLEKERLKKLAEKEASLEKFTKNGEPTLADDADAESKKLHKEQVKSYHDYKTKLEKEIAVLKIPQGKDSALNNYVVFGKDGVAKKLSPTEAADALVHDAIGKKMAKDAKSQKPLKEQCICRFCRHNPKPVQCTDACGDDVAKCVGTVKCTEKIKTERKSCIERMLEMELPADAIADSKLRWNVK